MGPLSLFVLLVCSNMLELQCFETLNASVFDDIVVAPPVVRSKHRARCDLEMRKVTPSSIYTYASDIIVGANRSGNKTELNSHRDRGKPNPFWRIEFLNVALHLLHEN